MNNKEKEMLYIRQNGECYIDKDCKWNEVTLGCQKCRDKVVLDKEEYESIQKLLTYDKPMLDRIYNFIEDIKGQVRRETARRIYKKGKERDDDFDMTGLGEYIMANFLTDENGVEVE